MYKGANLQIASPVGDYICYYMYYLHVWFKIHVYNISNFNAYLSALQVIKAVTSRIQHHHLESVI